MRAGAEAIRAALHVYDLCQPAQDTTICRESLETVLTQHVGRPDDLAALLESMGGDGVGISDRFDFLSYWQGIDGFFAKASRDSSASSGSEHGVFAGLRRFRDGVLSLWRKQASKDGLAAMAILSLLEDIRAGADDKQYWAEVKQSIPPDGALGLLEVSEAVCTWLRDAVDSSSPSTLAPPYPAEEALLQANLKPPRRSEVFLREGHRQRPRRVSSPSPEPGAVEFTVSPSMGRKYGRRTLTVAGDCDGGAIDHLFSGEDSAHDVQLDVQRIQELLELIMRSGNRDSSAAQTASSRLLATVDHLAQSFKAVEEKANDFQKNNEHLRQRKDTMEEEMLAMHVYGEEAHKVTAERDEALRHVDLLTGEVTELKEHYAAASQELRQLKAKHADAERAKLDTQRRDLEWRGRLEHLEQQAENAEGQASYMREEVVRTRTQLTESENWKQEARRLSDKLQEVKAALRSYQGAAEEEGDCVQQLQQQLAAAEQINAMPGLDPRRLSTGRRVSWSLDKPADMMKLEKQVQSQQAEVLRLRASREALLKAQNEHQDKNGWQADDDATPEDTKARYELRFHKAQVEAMATHCHELEELLDKTRDAELGLATCPDSKRRLSIQHVQQEGLVLFNEMSEQLYTLQVQKADADHELRRLAARVQEQEELVRSLKSTRGGQDAPKFNDTGGAATVTSETRSCASGSTPNSGYDTSDFLMRFSGRIMPNPKVQAVQAFMEAGASPKTTKSAPAGRGQKHADGDGANWAIGQPRGEDGRRHVRRGDSQTRSSRALCQNHTDLSHRLERADRKRAGQRTEPNQGDGENCTSQ